MAVAHRPRHTVLRLGDDRSRWKVRGASRLIPVRHQIVGTRCDAVQEEAGHSLGRLRSLGTEVSKGRPRQVPQRMARGSKSLWYPRPWWFRPACHRRYDRSRYHKKPYLGICLGMQIAVIEYARNVCGIKDATSEEFDGNAANKLIMFMPEVDKTTMGASMRLGLRPTLFQPGSEWSRLRALYAGKDEILERHRHRYEVNPDYIETLEKGGLSFVGKDEAGVRMEVIEIKDHPWFVGVQFHPEYLSRVLDPSRPYLGFIAASAGMLEEITKAYQHGAANGLGAEGIANGVDGLKIAMGK
jgi:hypothetical protein